MIDGHGDDLWRYGDLLIRHNFSTNIHAAFDHRPLMEHIASDLSVIGSYPEPEPLSVERALASLYGIDPGNVMVTNGATDFIYLLAGAAGARDSAILIPTFREYQDAAVAGGHNLHFISSLRAIPRRADMVWLCNPNNPTGRVIPRLELLDAVDSHPKATFVIDQAYADYTAEPLLSAADVVSRSNVIVMSSLTKRFAIPGLRIGYAVAPPQLLERVRRRRIPWSVSGPAIRAALFLLRHMDDYPIDHITLHREAGRIRDAFERMGIDALPTDCNFILCRLPRGRASELKDYLVRENAILIRDASNFESLTPAHFRVAAQEAYENDLLIDSLGRWLTRLF